MIRVTGSAQETLDLASSFARQLQRGDVVALFGELGTGKTQFVKGMCSYFQVQEHITSPTFVLLNRYSGNDKNGREILLFHFDLYRIKSVAEVYDLGYEEFFSGEGICFVEWPEQLADLLPQRRYDVRLSFGASEDQREIEIIQNSSEPVGAVGKLS